MATIASNLNFPTSRQVPDQAILQKFGKAAYLGNQYSLPIAGFSISGTSETNVALISMPASASVSLFLCLRQISAVANLAQFNFYVNPTATAGTTVTPVNVRPAMSAVSQSVCSKAPTDSVLGTLISTLECPTGNGAYVDADSLFILDPGQSMLITCTPAGTTAVSINLSWFEL